MGEACLGPLQRYPRQDALRESSAHLARFYDLVENRKLILAVR